MFVTCNYTCLLHVFTHIWYMPLHIFVTCIYTCLLHIFTCLLHVITPVYYVSLHLFVSCHYTCLLHIITPICYISLHPFLTFHYTCFLHFITRVCVAVVHKWQVYNGDPASRVSSRVHWADPRLRRPRLCHSTTRCWLPPEPIRQITGTVAVLLVSQVHCYHNSKGFRLVMDLPVILNRT